MSAYQKRKIRPTVTDVRAKLEQLNAHFAPKVLYAERIWELEAQLVKLIEQYVTANLAAKPHQKE